MSRKNIGIVKWFGGAKNPNYGFIKFLCGNDNPDGDGDLFFHRDGINSGSYYPIKDDFVSFDVAKGKKGLNAVNVTKIDAQTLANEIDFADETNCEKIFQEILDTKGKIFLAHFLDTVPEENFCKYVWLRKKLSTQQQAELFVKYFDELKVDEVADRAVDLEKFLSPAEIIQRVEDKQTFREKFSALVEGCTAQTSKFNDWAKIILANDFPPEIILSRWDDLNNENKVAAFVKYFDELSVYKLAELAKNLSPAEIIQRVEDKKTFAEKISTIINCSDEKFSWACHLIDNTELFQKIKVDNDVMIFFMYESVKRANHMSDLTASVKLLREKISDIEASPRVKIVYLYICAKHEYLCKNFTQGGTLIEQVNVPIPWA